MSEQTMTATAARTFQHGRSTAHATILELAARERGCQCKPYVDWFTYNRWQAQGYQVQRGEHGTKLVTYPTVEEKGKDGKARRKSFPRRTTVFCRCQVQPAAEA